MQRLSVTEKKESLGGACSKKKGASRPASSSSKKLSDCNTKLHNFSLMTLSTIPGLITLGEELYQLIMSRRYSSPAKVGYGGSFAGSEYSSGSAASNRRDFFAYASEAFRPSIRFSPYYYKSGITFGMPWLK